MPSRPTCPHRGPWARRSGPRRLRVGRHHRDRRPHRPSLRPAAASSRRCLPRTRRGGRRCRWGAGGCQPSVSHVAASRPCACPWRRAAARRDPRSTSPGAWPRRSEGPRLRSTRQHRRPRRASRCRTSSTAPSGRSGSRELRRTERQTDPAARARRAAVPTGRRAARARAGGRALRTRRRCDPASASIGWSRNAAGATGNGCTGSGAPPARRALAVRQPRRRTGWASAPARSARPAGSRREEPARPRAPPRRRARKARRRAHAASRDRSAARGSWRADARPRRGRPAAPLGASARSSAGWNPARSRSLRARAPSPGCACPRGRACSFWRVWRYAVMPASSWPRRSWLTVSPTLVLLAAAVSSLRRRARHELGDVDAARSGEHPEVALGDRRPCRARSSRARAAQPSTSCHFRQRQPLLAADRPQVLAQLLRRDADLGGRLGHASSYRRP